MTKREAKAVMRKAFSALTEKQRERLRWHAERKTPICCGGTAWDYLDGYGGG